MSRILPMFFALTIAVLAGIAIDRYTTTTEPAMTQTQVENIVDHYLVTNPEVLERAARALQSKQQVAQQAQSEKAALENVDEIFDHAGPFVGDANSTTMIAEFFDYQCGHCQDMQVIMDQFLTAHPHTKVVYKELPIFGAKSQLAAQAALAAHIQGHYTEMHKALMDLAIAHNLSEETIYKAAEDLKLDVERLKADMKDTVVKGQLEKTKQLATALGVRGTPTLVVRSPATHNQPKTLFGAVPLTELEKQVE